MSRGLTFALVALAFLACGGGLVAASASDALIVAPDAGPQQKTGAAPRGWTNGGRVAVRPDPNGPDESALRYYASQNQTARVQVEMQRLRTLYPNWKPPKNLYATHGAGGGDESALWALFAANKLDELRAAIVQRARQQPGWRPSSDLENKLRAKETHDGVMTLWKQGRWKDLLRFVKSGSYDPSTADTETLWTVAAAYAKAKQTSGAIAIYKSILASDNNQQERLATFQKAMATLRMSDVEPLLAMARTLPDGKPEYAPIMIDIIRARIGAFLHEERTQEIPDDQLRAFETFAQATAAQPNEAGLVAWYYFKLKAFDSALAWFKIALAHGGDAMIAHGLANSLEAMGFDRQAEEVAYAWRKPLVNNDIFFIDVVEKALTQPAPDFISPARLARYAQVTMDTQSGEGAQALAWYAYNSCQFDIALEWFQRAVAWYPKETSVRGYALALQRLHKMDAYYVLMNRYDGVFPQLLDLIFPDGSRHAPTLCERRPPGIRHGQAQQFSGFMVPGPAQKTDVGRDVRIAPEPRFTVLTRARRARMPKISRSEFPVSTDPQNPLRSFVRASGAANFGLSYLSEPSRGPWPLVAHRVPGVGPMPYERYGFTLLPGWNGVTQPTWPPYSAQPAAPGTLAAQDAAETASAPTPGARAPDFATPPSALGTTFGAPQTNPVPPAPTPPFPASTPWLQPSGNGPAPAPFAKRVPGSGQSSRRAWDSQPVGAIDPAPTGPAPILAGQETPPLVLHEPEPRTPIAVAPTAPPPILAGVDAPSLALNAPEAAAQIVVAPEAPTPALAAAPQRWSVRAAISAASQFRPGAIK
ncbi:MAG TPA: hypothetical protein VMU56_09015 [Beijerinckiaceae bacterium]|nr:hypothetical protein [Beijerinckiaceae bacterium]